MCGRTKEAEEFWKQATNNYEKAVQLNWNSPQALNNWGLALQELSAIVPAREKQMIVKTAISKVYSSALRLVRTIISNERRMGMGKNISDIEAKNVISHFIA